MPSRHLCGNILGSELDVLLRGSLDGSAEVRADLGEHVISPRPSVLVRVAQVNRHVLDEVLLLAGGPAEDVPQAVCLLVVVGLDLVEEVSHGEAGPLLVLVGGLDGLVRQGAVAAGVVGVCAVVAVHGHGAVALEGVEGVEGCVHGDLLVVDAEPVSVGVGVGEETGLEHGVCRGLNARDEVGWGECDLLDLGKVVLHVLVERHLAKASKGHFGLRPDLRQVKDVPFELLGLLWRQCLDVDGPARVFALLDGLKEVLGGEVRVIRCQLASLLVVEGLASLVGLEMYLDINIRAVRLREFMGVSGVAIHEPVRVWSSSVREEVHDLVNRFLVRRL